MRFSDPCTLAFYRLQEMVARAETRRPLRTIEEEDLIALEDLILLEEGPDILVKYQRSWGAGVG